VGEKEMLERCLGVGSVEEEEDSGKRGRRVEVEVERERRCM